MKQTGHLSTNETLNKEKTLELLINKFKVINYKQAREDILPFIKNTDKIKIWSETFFNSITKEKLILD